MDFERRVSESLHHVADVDPPVDLVDRALAGLPARRRRDAFAWPLGGPALAVAAGIAAIVVVTLVVALLQRPGPLPPVGEPSPTLPLSATQPPCPAAAIEGTLVEVAPGELGLMQVPIGPREPTPRVMRIAWEPAHFSIIEDDLGRPVVWFEPGTMAFVGDYVRIGGGERGAGWYACGSLEVVTSSPLPPAPSPAIDDDAAAWHVLAAIDQHLGGIEQIRRIEWVGGTLHLTVSTGREDDLAFAEAAMQSAGFSGRASQSPFGSTFVALELRNARAVLDPSVRCGQWWHVELRALGDGAELSGEQLAVAGKIIRRRAADLMGPTIAHEIVVATEGSNLVVEVPMDEAGFDEAVYMRVRPSLLAPMAAEYMAVPPGVPPPSVGSRADGLDPLFGGAGVEDARPALDRDGRPVLDVILREQVAADLDAYAAANVGGQLALVMEGLVVAAPSIESPSFDGQLRMMGVADDFSLALLVFTSERLRIGVDVLEFEELDAGEVERDC